MIASPYKANDCTPPSIPSSTVHTPHPRSANTSRAQRRTLAATESAWQRLGAHQHRSRMHSPPATRIAKASAAFQRAWCATCPASAKTSPERMMPRVKASGQSRS